tara:strand:- start:282 stop:623 length:342 start_codon:yes stop_codon:yes gene_type:complete
MTSTASAGINSVVTIDSNEFVAATSIETTIEKERIDITGFGDSSRSFTMGLTGPREFTVRTYADPTGLVVGTSYTISITIAGDDAITGTATCVNYNSSADIDGATVHEIGLLM